MKNKEDIKAILDYFQANEEVPLEFDNEAIEAAYQRNDETQSLAIKILSIFGGILASFAFLGFLLIARLYESGVGLLVLGIICIAGALAIKKKYDKIIIDTISVSSFIIGFLLLIYGFYQLEINCDTICCLFIVIAFTSIVIAQDYILSFLSTLIVNGSILTLILSNKYEDIIHIYVSVLALILSYFYLKEAKIVTINKSLSKLYNPIRIGLTFSFIAGFAFLGIRLINWFSPDFIWLSSVIIISVIIYLVSGLFDVLNITKKRHKAVVYIFTVLVLLPTAFSPAVSGAILIILLSFFVNYKTGFVLGVIAFIYFISQYYYDMNFTLLIKSILLFSSGVLFLALYLFTRKKLTSNEKI